MASCNADYVREKNFFYNGIDAQKWFVGKNSLEWVHSYQDGMYVFEKRITPTNRVLEIEDLGYTDDYVYDVETEDGTFMAGVGCNIVKNTDSIYTKFTLPGQEGMSEDEKTKKVYEVSEECAKRISNTFKKPIELEMEDLKYPIALYCKKKYVYRQLVKNKYGEIEDKGMNAKGLQTVRRDSCKYVKKVCNPILEEMMYGRDIGKAKSMAREFVRNLLENNVDINDLVITKSLKSKYKTVNKAGQKMSKPAHWFLSQRMLERDPGTAPKPGDRIPFVFIQNPDRNALQADKIETPEWVSSHPKTCKLDMIHYLQKQLESPLGTIFQVVIRNKDGELFPLDKHGKMSKEYKRELEKQIWGDLVIRYTNNSKGQKQINDFFGKARVEDMEYADSDDEIIDC